MTGAESYGTLFKGWLMDFLFVSETDDEVLSSQQVTRSTLKKQLIKYPISSSSTGTKWLRGAATVCQTRR